MIDDDSYDGEVCGCLKQGASYGYNSVLGYTDPRDPSRKERRSTTVAEGLSEHQKGIKRFVDELIAGSSVPARPASSCCEPTRDSGTAKCRAARAGRLAVLDRGADDQDRSGGRGRDRRGRLAADHLPRPGRGADRRDRLRHSQDEEPRPSAARNFRSHRALSAAARASGRRDSSAAHAEQEAQHPPHAPRPTRIQSRQPTQVPQARHAHARNFRSRPAPMSGEIDNPHASSEHRNAPRPDEGPSAASIALDCAKERYVQSAPMWQRLIPTVGLGVVSVVLAAYVSQ